ncbi:MAG: hypothetical protein J3Q66DRAFT_388526 [Benniella sp.]|nr:MAG: hypothetical protein J3Q66DRAFT_388526 [Benniella sp.]
MSKLEEAPTPKEQVSRAQMALSCPEILYAIGEELPVFDKAPPNTLTMFQFSPRVLLNCCSVSKFWREVLMPLLWRVDDTKSMKNVPIEVLTQYKDHVRTFTALWSRYQDGELAPIPAYTFLRKLNMGTGVKKGKDAARLIGENKHLVTLEMHDVPLFEDLSENERKGVGMENGDSDSFSLTNPMGHLSKSLEELSVSFQKYRGMEFYYFLRAVAGGNLRFLNLSLLSGTFDLRDLVFTSLTRLHLWLDDKTLPGLHEIIGRSPHLEHLELSGLTYVADNYSLVPLAHILRGTEIPRINSPMKRWFRPQLAVLRLYGLHVRRTHTVTEQVVNDNKFLELIRACGATYNKHKKTGHIGPLRELALSVWVLDDRVKETIEIHSSSLEVLKIKISQRPRRTPTKDITQQILTLRRIIQTCARLKKFDFRDLNGDVDISVMMAILMDGSSVSEHGNDKTNKVEAWESPDLEFMSLRTFPPFWPRTPTEETEHERQFSDDEESKDDPQIGTWMMPTFKWDSGARDGTDLLLDTRWSSFEIFDVENSANRSRDGEQLIKRFLRHVSPSKKLKELQLGQIKLLRQLTLAYGVVNAQIAMRLIKDNMNLVKLSIYNRSLFGKSTSIDSTTSQSMDDDLHVSSPTNPLGHLQTTLQELHLFTIHFKGPEFYWLLRPVAKGRLRTLRLFNLTGIFDLQDLIFESLTRLDLNLNNKMQDVCDIIGRCPHLRHLEINGDNINRYSYDSLIRVLRGTPPEEKSSETEERFGAMTFHHWNWSRPQLSTLRLHGLHSRCGDWSELSNNKQFLELIRACGAIYNRHRQMEGGCFLRELVLLLWVLDDPAREAIEIYSTTLEVLEIKILRQYQVKDKEKGKQQSRVLKNILQSCSRLKRLEFWDMSGKLDVLGVMEGLMEECESSSNKSDNDDDDGGGGGDEIEMCDESEGQVLGTPKSIQHDRDKVVKAWDCPEMESLSIRSFFLNETMKLTRVEEERRFDDDSGSNDSGISIGTWVMPAFKWNDRFQEGTGFLLDAHWSSFELFDDAVADVGRPKEGEELIMRFLRHISPMRKLKALQLGQLKLIRR